MSIRKIIPLLLILFVNFVPVVFAEWYKDYESAMDLIKKNQFDAAVPKLQSAISQKPDEGNNIKFYGMKFGDYFPHYYLGLAYFNSKDYPAAMKQFEASERYGAVQKKSDLAGRLASMKTLAQAQLVVKSTPPPIVPVNPPQNQQVQN